MDLAHLHLMLNHVPVIGVIFGFLVLFAGLATRLKTVAAVGLGLLIIAGLVAIPVYLTGEPAQEIVEHMPGVSEVLIDEHESAAAISLVSAMLTALFSIAALVFFRSRLVRIQGYLVIASLLISLITGVLMVQTANLGGQIRHTEIRAAVLPATSGAETRHTENGKSEHHDDE